MNHWQTTFLGLKQLPRELSGFEIEAFFTFTASERALIEARRGPSLNLGLALQIGFLRMSGRVLDAVRIAPTRTEGINMRGLFRFPIEQYADQLLPSRVPPKMHVFGQ
jgi:hypothetical protein